MAAGAAVGGIASRVGTGAAALGRPNRARADAACAEDHRRLTHMAAGAAVRGIARRVGTDAVAERRDQRRARAGAARTNDHRRLTHMAARAAVAWVG